MRKAFRHVLIWAGALLAAAPVLAQDEAGAANEAATEEPVVPERTGFLTRFKDEEDGKLDFSKVLAAGGFLPMPVIITEPAVDGGFGMIAQFISTRDGNLAGATRRMLGAVKTGNGSYGYGYFQSGQIADGRVSYKVGIGRGKITLDAHPALIPDGLRYTNHYDYGLMGSARLHLADRRFSLGPSLDFRKLRSELDFASLPPAVAPYFNQTLTTGALGFGVHFDSRDNPLTPTRGMNVQLDGKFNDGAFGSDRDFQTYDVGIYAFSGLAQDWRLGVKATGASIAGDYPLYFAPAIDLRGVEKQRYQGSHVLSAEVEVVRQLSSRWSILAFAGYGSADGGERRVFDDSGAIFAGGVGFRYRIARALGLDAGVDVAYGPNGATFYLQFGHAWALGMD